MFSSASTSLDDLSPLPMIGWMSECWTQHQHLLALVLSPGPWEPQSLPLVLGGLHSPPGSSGTSIFSPGCCGVPKQQSPAQILGWPPFLTLAL
ncbi:hypothetical protein ATANTOWER_029045 [Ataeniobius toweri]|uniref:Uncharacterized protein n=1 Tax=Ataeniobius toweri TaxID=208326 RepID=A0ABU7AD26_9TELE|nr:hypothetical protein [Ataeniobius toweri]